MSVLITGATSGFGLALARRFVGAVRKIIAAGRRTERLELLTAEYGENLVHPLQFDIRDRHAVTDGIAEIPDAFADIDILVNNAGLASGREPAQDANLDGWESMVDTNVKD